MRAGGSKKDSCPGHSPDKRDFDETRAGAKRMARYNLQASRILTCEIAWSPRNQGRGRLDKVTWLLT